MYLCFLQVIFAPLFITRSHLPASLLMNIETPRLKNSMQIEVKGQGQEENLPCISGDMTHSITFQLRSVLGCNHRGQRKSFLAGEGECGNFLWGWIS